MTQVFTYEVKSHTVHRNNIGYQSLNKVSYYRNNGDIQFQILVLSSSYRYFVSFAKTNKVLRSIRASVLL